MKRALTAVLVLGALMAPSTAHAEPFTPALEADYQAALQWWGSPAGPPQCSSVDAQLVPAASIEGNWGLATQPKPGWSGPCILRIAVEITPCQDEWVVRHEVGHLLGFDHSSDPSSPMAVGQPDPCRRIESVPRLEQMIEEERARARWLSSHLPRKRALCRQLVDRKRIRFCWDEVALRIEWLGQVREGIAWLEGLVDSPVS